MSTLEPEIDQTQKELEKLVPFSEARVFRTDKGFILRDVDDETWCKYVPFDDIDRVKTEVAYRTLDPVRISAMKAMQLPKMTELSKEVLDEFESEFENLCTQRNDEDQEMIISSLWADDDTTQTEQTIQKSSQRSTDSLTKTDVIQQHFGTLTPYVDDYIQNTYETEEEHTTHLPALTHSYPVTVSNKYGPLSYQHSVLEEDPASQEDLDEEQDIELPSELLPNLIRAHLDVGPKDGSDKNAKNETPNDEIPEPEPEPEFDDWTLFKNSIPTGFLPDFVISSLLLIVIGLGLFIQFPIILLMGAFSILHHFGPKTVRSMRDIFTNFLNSYLDKRERRRRFTNKKGLTDRVVQDPSKLQLKTSERKAESVNMCPLDGIHIIKPEGSVASSNKVKRTYHIEPAKISEARIIKTIDDRHFFRIKFFEYITRLALYDPGACSCTISPKFLEELQTIGHVPMNEANLNIKGVIQKASEKANKIAYLDFQLETGYWLKNVPFVVFDSGNDILIGNNLIRAHRWANCWKNDNFYIDIGNNEPLIPTYLTKPSENKEIGAITISKMTIYPTETTTIGLSIPYMGSQSLSHFKHRDLLVEPLFENEDNDMLEYYPTLSRHRKNELNIVVRNKGDMPIEIEKGMEVAKVSTLAREAKPLEIRELHDAKKTYNSIPRIHTKECHCHINNRLERGNGKDIKEEKAIRILISDPLGNTSIGNILELSNSRNLEPGIHIIEPQVFSTDCHFAYQRDKICILLVTDDEGSLAHIDKIMIKRAHQQLKEKLKHDQVPLYFFLDPLHSISFSSRLVINDVFKQFQFSFYPVRTTGCTGCVRPALNINDPELLVGVNKTRIHIQNGPVPLPEESLRMESGSPEIEMPFYGGYLKLFRIDQTFVCHLHLPYLNLKCRTLKETERNNILTRLFSELRFLRVPTNMEITTDGHNAHSGAKLPEDYIKDTVYKVVKKLPPFYQPAVITSWPCLQSEQHPWTFLPKIRECDCSLCMRYDLDEEERTSEVIVYQGDINDLICAAPYPSSSTSSTSSRSTKVSSALQVAIASICEIDDDFDSDQPLDYMNLCGEDEMQDFLHTHPGTEPDEEDVSKLPPPQTSNPELFKGFDMEGIPDQFRPGDWKTTDIMDRLQNVTEKIKTAFGELLDKHVNVISYHASDCRPVLLHGKPAIVDISLTTDDPIFMKPYMVSGAAVDALDKKLDELIEKNEIHPIESKYNVAIILTHHNSSQKHVDGSEKKVRLVLDMRWVNAVMKDKNLHSYLVKKIELLFMAIHGAKVMTSFDITKAYRALVASFKLQQICAFRTPSSRKYPSVTWAFRSACDGLANLPGYYSYLMQEALSKEAKQFCIAHIDDILIYSKSDEEHLKHLDIVLTDLGKSNFMVSAKKMQPFQRQINFLGHMLDGEKKWIPDDRRSYFDLLEPPQTKKQLQSLLGVSNYMSGFIDSYAFIVGPLYDALKGKSDKAPIVLNEIQMKAFLELKKAISTAPRLGLLDTSRTIYMECDASLTGSGSVCYHVKEENGKEVREIIRYGSRRFSLTESLNHTSLEREAMAILIGVKQHMSFLEACPEAVIKTDLKSLITLLSCYNNPESVRMARMSHRLYSLPFKWSLIHIPGVDLPIADALSRLYKPYTSLYTDRHLRYPDLKRDNIMMPPEWRNKPNLILTTADLLEAMHQQIVFIEKSSTSVKEKRLKALIQEVSIQYEELTESREQLATMLEEDLLRCRDKIQQEKSQKAALKLSSLTAVSQRTLVTPEFIIENQNKNPKLHNIITMLRTLPKEKIPTKILKRFRLLNDSILVTRKSALYTFEHPGNLRIVCDAKMTIHILCLIHVMYGHFGMNTLNHTFINTYKCIEKSTQGFVKLVCTACRSCKFHRQTNKKVVPYGRIPLPNVPNDTWMIDFMVFQREQTFNGRKVAAAFNVVDLFSNLFISIPVKNQKAPTVIECLKFIFAQFNVPRKIVSDNAKALCRNPAVVHFLKTNNVKQIATTTSHNSQGNKVERMHKTFRDTLKLVQETFKREKQFDLYYTVVQMMNSRTLSLSLHPHIKEICKSMGQDPGVITPFALHFGLPTVKHPLIPLENTLEPESRGAFRAKWQHIITEYDKQLQKELDERQEQFKGRIIEEGDLVLIRNIVAHKEQLRFYKDIYEVIKINKARYFCAPLFTKGAIMEVNGNNLKPYAYSELFSQLPDDIRLLMGENLSPEELKKQAEQDPDSLPNDLHSWQQWNTPTTMSLRNRISPQYKLSEPALSVRPDSDIMSDSSDSSSSLFEIPDKVSEYKSEASSLLNKSGVSQLKTTSQGFITSPYKTQLGSAPSANTQGIVPLLEQAELNPNITIRHKKPTTLTNNAPNQTVSWEEVQDSWKQRVEKEAKRRSLEQLLDSRLETTLQQSTKRTPRLVFDNRFINNPGFDAKIVQTNDISEIPGTPIAKTENIEKTPKLGPTPIDSNIRNTPPLSEKAIISTETQAPPLNTDSHPTTKKVDFSTKTDTPPLNTDSHPTLEKVEISTKLDTPPIIDSTPSTLEKTDIKAKQQPPPLIMPELLKTKNPLLSQNTEVPPITPPKRNATVQQNTPYTPYTPSSAHRDKTSTDTEQNTPKSKTDTDIPHTNTNKTTDKTTDTKTNTDKKESIKYRLRPRPFKFLGSKR